MKRDKLIANTKELLKNLCVIKERIKTEVCTEEEKIIASSLLRALNKLNAAEQQIIAYKYFENKKQTEISIILNVDEKTITRRLKKIYLKIGRLVYGFEEEFLSEINGVSAEDNFYNKIIDDVVKEVMKRVLFEIKKGDYKGIILQN